MWQEVFDTLKLFFNLSEEMRRSREDTENLQRQNKILADNLQEVNYELRLLRESQMRDFENLELRLKLALSEAKNQNQLPPGKGE